MEPCTLRLVRCLLVGILAASALLPQATPLPPDLQELLDALGRTAALFSRTAPHLGAREVLDQRGRRSEMEVIRRDRRNQLKTVSFTVPELFELHHVVSDYTLGSPVPGGGFHELRKTISVDGEAAVVSAALSASSPGRRPLALGFDTVDDGTKRQLLEELQLERLQGAATDFGPILLLFTTARQRDAVFSLAGRETLDTEPAWIVSWRQTAGDGALTEFRNRRETRHLPEGRIWFRESDLLPLRISLNTQEYVTPKYLFRNEAEVAYQPTKFGLAPQTVVHRQFLNHELLMENRFRYSSYKGQEIIP